jgi:hypothetical protein
MVPWMSDARLVFLIWFVSIAVAVAVVLVFVEIRFKKKKERAAAARRRKTPIERMKIILNKEGDVKRKFEIVGKTAKNYFKEEYGMASGLDYSELAKQFEKREKVLEAEFCEKMFELYYSKRQVTEKGVEDLGEMLVEMDRKKKVSKDISKVPSVWERVDRVFGKKNDVVMSKWREYVASLREKMDRKARTKAREEHELLSWVKKAIRMGHDKKGLSDLLKDGGKSKYETKKILKIYDIEAARASGKKSSARLYGGEGGVAQRVIQKEKDRLEKMESLGV